VNDDVRFKFVPRQTGFSADESTLSYLSAEGVHDDAGPPGYDPHANYGMGFEERKCISKNKTKTYIRTVLSYGVVFLFLNISL